MGVEVTAEGLSLEAVEIADELDIVDAAVAPELEENVGDAAAGDHHS